MAKYSIKDLENFTKIKAHTLRIWEQRYQLLKPERTDTNIRYYSDKDLKKILNINLLYNNGLKISKIAKLSEKELFERAAEILLEQEVSNADLVGKFVEHVLELDEYSIHELLSDLREKMPMEDLFVDVLIPLLEKIGTLWQVDAISVSHEHFLSNLLREFLIVSIDRIPLNKITKGKVVLFLKENEKHELSLLFYYYVLKKRGYDCFYLGQSVPMKDLQQFTREIKPDYLFTSVIAELPEEDFQQFLKGMEEIIDLNHVFIGGYQLHNHKEIIPSEIRQIHKLGDIHLA